MSKYSFATGKTKFRIGDKPIEFSEITKLDTTISFAFDNISLSKNVLCFNNEKIEIKKYFEIIEYMHYLSSIKLEQLVETEKEKFNFHIIDLSKKYQLKTIILKIFKSKNSSNIPEICSFKAGLEEEKLAIAPRFVGFFGINGIFHLLFLDYFHVIYPSSICKIKEKDWVDFYFEKFNV